MNGHMHELRPPGDDTKGGPRIPGTDVAVLEHGSIIDLSGVQLIFQDYEHMKKNKPNEETLDKFFGNFNQMRVQCPVNLQTVRYRSGSSFGGTGKGARGASAIEEISEEEGDENGAGEGSSPGKGSPRKGKGESIESYQDDEEGMMKKIRRPKIASSAKDGTYAERKWRREGRGG